MHLFDLNDFGLRFGVDMSVSDYNSAVTEASKAATATIASRFRFTSFGEYFGRRDMFRVDRAFGSASSQYRTFKLSRGFVDSETSGFSCYYSSNPLHLRNNETDNLTDLQDTNQDGQSDYLVIDGARGTLSVFTLDLTDLWVLCTYDGGLALNNSDQYVDVPDWLAEAGMAQAAIFLKQNRIFQTDEPDDLNSLKAVLAHTFATYGRFYPAAIQPTMSEPGR